MATANQKAGKNTDTPKRKVLTPAEKIAKLEAELKAAREKAHDKDRKVIQVNSAKVKDLAEKRDKLNVQIDQLSAEITEAQGRIDGPVTDGVGEADSDA